MNPGNKAQSATKTSRTAARAREAIIKAKHFAIGAVSRTAAQQNLPQSPLHLPLPARAPLNVGRATL